jgi:predicted  nucleic acid-binding Zn-ribbon protein|tara:strand:+ start:1074 stop:1274 length:201 start_codon:yes stop_codon:yes gene_type:complete
MRDIREELEQAARELAEAKATIKKLQHQKQDLQYQVAWGLNEVKSLNKRLKEQSPLIDMDNMKGAN